MKTQFLCRHCHKFGFPIPHPLFTHIIALFPESGDPIFCQNASLTYQWLKICFLVIAILRHDQHISHASLSQHPNIAVWATPSSQAAPSAAKLVLDATSSVAIASSPGPSSGLCCLTCEHQHPLEAWRTSFTKTLGCFHLMQRSYYLCLLPNKDAFYLFPNSKLLQHSQ